MSLEELQVLSCRELTDCGQLVLSQGLVFQSLDSKSLHTPLTVLQQEQIQQLSHKRLQRMPVQYVLGEWDFQDLTLKMRPPVFIPRPETEDLVSLVVEEEFRKCENSALCFPVPVPHPVILEVGCGSGAIALSLLRKLPQVSSLQYYGAVDASVRGQSHSVIFIEMSQTSVMELRSLTGSSRVIAMDKEEAAVDLTRENAHSYEDLDALDGGDDGMKVIKTILSLASSLLKVSGSLFLEVDPRHPNMVDHWLHLHPDLLLTLHTIHKDFCGKPRFLHIQKQSS
ncbi:HemK methyltransferase family member 1 [Turdus rufiventris]|nr:HemK methyltransferase family member 1 [Turdus rufiventris]